jgi:sugar phosphate isomerase/epimerase
MTRRSFLLSAPAAAAAAPPRSNMGIATTSFMTFRQPKITLDFLEYAHSLGAGGIQAALSSLDSEYPRKVRDRAEELGMYIEVMAPLPRGAGNASLVERIVTAAKEAGALCLRAACLGGRRYETFQDLPSWQRFITDSRASIDQALRIVEKRRIPLALENHKDWTVDEMLALLRDYESEYLGVCLDTGNNIALLDEPYTVVNGLAPYAISTHIKDMAWDLYEDGFLLAEVPLGEGMLDIERIARAIRKARPQTRMTLEMITRNPLQVPCLLDRYWATFPDRGGRYLAATLRMIRERKPPRGLPRMDGLARDSQLRLEEDNVKQCLHYARERLGL